MSATWAAFARSGTPDNAAIPHWPSYSLADRATLIFDSEPRIVSDYGGEQRLLWKEITGMAS
jgi:para-nitrobenzyl esterase